MTLVAKKIQIDSKKTLITALLLLITCLLMLLYSHHLYDLNINNLNQNKYAITNPQRLIVGFLMGLIALILYRLFKFNVIYPILLVTGSIYILSFPYFTVVDETYHFAFIDYIANHYRIPHVQEYVPNRVFAVAQKFYPGPSPTDPATLGVLGVIYEAFQPPLYYIIAAIVYKLALGNAVLAVFFIKFLGLFFLLSTVFIVKKMYDYGIKKRIIKSNDFVLFAVLLLLSITPGYMLRMVTISNVNLLPALGALQIYFILKYSFEETFKYKYHNFILALLTSGMVLTQFTAIYLIPLTALFVLWKKDIKNAVYFCLTVGALISPWFIMNYIYYGTSTAGNIVMEMQKSIVNPNNDSFGPWYVAMNLPRMFAYFWNPQEGGYPDQPLFLIIEFLTGFMAIAIISILYTYIKYILTKKPASLFFVFCSASMLSNIVIVIFITIHQSWDILIGRYIYMSISEIAILLFVYISRMRRDNKNVLSILLVIIALLLYSNFLGKIVSDKVIPREKHSVTNKL